MSNFSVNTNFSAAVALQNLQRTASDITTTQSRLSTGLAVSSTKDDSANFTIAQSLRGDVGGLKAVTASLNRAKSVVDVAVAGAESISDILNRMEDLARRASDTGADANSRAAFNRDFQALAGQVTSIIEASGFNGTNLLLTGGGTVAALRSLQSNAGGAAGNTQNVANAGLDTALNGVLTGNISTAAGATTMMADIQTQKTALSTTLSTLGSASRAVDAQLTFTSKLSDVMESGIGKLVDADLAKESARIQALQVKQQLGVQALAIANQTPQAILSLFR